MSNEEEQQLDTYLDNNGLSDSKMFKEAVLKDIQHVDIRKVNLDIKYLIGRFFDRGLDIIPTMDDVQKGDYSRGEVFAQLFAHATGAQDSNKEKMLKMFPNTYKVVKNFISQYTK